MNIFFEQEISVEIHQKFGFIATDTLSTLNTFFKDKHYGVELDTLYISIFCMSPKFENFFREPRPKYTGNDPDDGKSLEYQYRLDFIQYFESDNLKPLLANDILRSLDVIKSVKKLKDFDLERLRIDLREYFKHISWL